MKFGMQMHTIILCFQGRLLNKMLKFCKFKMADGRHIEYRLLAISAESENDLLAIFRNCEMSFTRIFRVTWATSLLTSAYRINAKFCRIKQNHVLTQDT